MHAYLLAWWFGFGAVAACLVVALAWRAIVIAAKISTDEGKRVFRMVYDFLRGPTRQWPRHRAAWSATKALWVNRRIIY